MRLERCTVREHGLSIGGYLSMCPGFEEILVFDRLRTPKLLTNPCNEDHIVRVSHSMNTLRQDLYIYPSPKFSFLEDIFHKNRNNTWWGQSWTTAILKCCSRLTITTVGYLLTLLIPVPLPQPLDSKLFIVLGRYGRLVLSWPHSHCICQISAAISHVLKETFKWKSVL